MLTKEQLRDIAWRQLRAANSLFDQKMWDAAVHDCGYAVEMMLKARICIDRALAGFPETPREFTALKKSKGIWLKTHGLEELLNLTVLVTQVKRWCFNEWSVCVQWSPETRYVPVGTANEISAKELIRSATAVMRRIVALPGIQDYDVAQFDAIDNPYLKLIVAERELSEERGEFELFMVCHRAHSFLNSSDIVVAAPWIDPDSRRGADRVSNAIQRVLVGDDIKSVSGVVAIRGDNPGLQTLQQAIDVRHSGTELGNCTFGQIHIDSAMLITCQRL